MTQIHIEEFGKTSILGFSKVAYDIAREEIEPYSSKYSKKKFTLQQHVVIICLKIRSGSTYEEIVERLVEEPRIRDALDLEEVPHPTTLVKAFGKGLFLLPLLQPEVVRRLSPSSHCSNDALVFSLEILFK